MHWLVFSDVKTLINLLVLLISDAAQEKETLTEAGTCLTALLVSAGLESEWNSTEDLGVSTSYWTLTGFSFPLNEPGLILNISRCLTSDSWPACPVTSTRYWGAFLRGHYWMNTETRLEVNGQFGYTAVRLELLRVMYRLSTCQLYKGGSRLCKCVCK